jgi:hypothetical protein
VKSEFRRLNLGSTFTPVESEPQGRIMLSRASRLERAGLFLCAGSRPSNHLSASLGCGSTPDEGAIGSANWVDTQSEFPVAAGQSNYLG